MSATIHIQPQFPVIKTYKMCWWPRDLPWTLLCELRVLPQSSYLILWEGKEEGKEGTPLSLKINWRLQYWHFAACVKFSLDGAGVGKRLNG